VIECNDRMPKYRKRDNFICMLYRQSQSISKFFCNVLSNEDHFMVLESANNRNVFVLAVAGLSKVDNSTGHVTVQLTLHPAVLNKVKVPVYWEPAAYGLKN